MDARLAYQGLMAIIGFMILIIHRATLVIIFPRRFKMPVIIGALLAALFLTMIYRRMTAGIIYWTALSSFANCVLMFLLFKASVFQIIFAFYFNYILSISLFYLTEISVRIFIDPASEIFIPVVFTILMILYAAFIALLIIYGRRLFKKLLEYGNKGEWALYAFGAVFSYIFMTITRDFAGTRLHVIMAILFIMWSFFVFCFAIINAHEKSKQKYEAEFARGVISASRDHYEKMNEQFNAIRTMKHDIKFHLNTARDMLRRGEIEKGDEYLRGLETQMTDRELPSFCENQVINSLVADYARRCNESNIELEVSISMPDDLSVPNYEMCIVLGNLLENALEACKRLKPDRNGQNRKIELAVKMQRAHLAIMVRNTFDGNVIKDGEKFISMKKNGGIGLQSVKAIAEKHCQSFFTEYDKERFRAFVLWKGGESR